MSRTLEVGSAWAGSILRVGSGLVSGKLGARPKLPLELYDREACPFCRLVREALTMLDLQAVIHPCPVGGTRYRGAVIERGGKSQFPYLVDPNTGVAMYESADIIAYLYKEYGESRVPAFLKWYALAKPLSGLASVARPTRGRRVRPSREPELRLELYSFEASPFCRLAREALCELEINYLLHNVGKRSPSRPAFAARAGKVMVPYLVDPNTGTSMYESADIVSYLNRTYAL